MEVRKEGKKRKGRTKVVDGETDDKWKPNDSIDTEENR